MLRSFGGVAPVILEPQSHRISAENTLKKITRRWQRDESSTSQKHQGGVNELSLNLPLIVSNKLTSNSKVKLTEHSMQISPKRDYFQSNQKGAGDSKCRFISQKVVKGSQNPAVK